MVAMLVLATIIILVLVDYYIQRKKQPAIAAQAESESAAAFPIDVVGGFKLPTRYSYHPGHAWAMKESPRQVRIGMDDFAVRLLGKIDAIDLPARGRWLRQGEKAWTIIRGGHRFEMLSSIEGEVVDVNEEIRKSPGRLLADPYGIGWLLEVHAPAADANLKNLLHGKLAHQWMEDSIIDLQAKINGKQGIHLQDGGTAVADVLVQVPEERWDGLVKDLLLT
jgi:glycine cleavage system H lipoate-binding protein